MPRIVRSTNLERMRWPHKRLDGARLTAAGHLSTSHPLAREAKPDKALHDRLFMRGGLRSCTRTAFQALAQAASPNMGGSWASLGMFSRAEFTR